MTKKQKSKWKLKEQATFLQRLGDLLDQGYTIEQATHFLRFQLREKHGIDVDLLLDRCKQGESLYDVFGEIGFHKDVLGYLYFAEKHGDISFALLESSSMLQKKITQLEKLKKLVRYPIFLLVFVGFMFAIIERILLPQFKDLYSSMNYKKNMMSELLFHLSSVNHIFLFVCSLLIVISFAIYYFHFRHLPATSRMKLLLKIPILSQFIILVNSHFFAIQLSNLLKGGLSIYQSLSMFEQQNHSHFFQEEAREMKKLLLAGEPFDVILRSRECYEADLAMIILHGQSNGNIAKELYQYSKYVIQRMEDRITKILAVVQPLLFSVIGIIILLMYAAIMVPMFKLINAI